MNFPNAPLQGNARQTTIAQANIVQSLVTTRTLVRSAKVEKDSTAAGTVLMSFGPTPLFTSLDLRAEPGEVFDLSHIQVKSTVAGDKVNFQSMYAT